MGGEVYSEGEVGSAAQQKVSLGNRVVANNLGVHWVDGGRSGRRKSRVAVDVEEGGCGKGGRACDSDVVELEVDVVGVGVCECYRGKGQKNVLAGVG